MTAKRKIQILAAAIGVFGVVAASRPSTAETVECKTTNTGPLCSESRTCTPTGECTPWTYYYYPAQ